MGDMVYSRWACGWDMVVGGHGGTSEGNVRGEVLVTVIACLQMRKVTMLHTYMLHSCSIIF